MRVWRISSEKYLSSPLDGEGARRRGGRWNSKGVPMVYTSGSEALATLEALVYACSLEDLAAMAIVLLPVDVPDELIEKLDETKLPVDWRRTPYSPETQRIGDTWMESGRSLGLEVPRSLSANPAPAEWGAPEAGPAQGGPAADAFRQSFSYVLLSFLMSKKFLPYDPSQNFLLAPNPRDWLPRGHLAYFVVESVQKLDLSEFYASYKEGPGAPPHDPRLMVSVLFYGNIRGKRSSRQIERALHEDIGFRVIAGQNKVDHDAICEFRVRHRRAIEGLFPQVLMLAKRAGLLELDHVAGDGTKIRANASKRKAMTLKRMREEEATLRDEVKRWMDEADEQDREENQRLGKKNGYTLPTELQDKEALRKFLDETIKELEEREQEEAKDRGRRSDEPRENAQYNFTDPESRVMPDSADKSHYVQAYNAQVAVTKRQFIVATIVTNNPIDNPHLPEVVHEIKRNVGHFPKEMSWDAGYARRENLVTLDALGIDGYVSTSKNKRDRIDAKNPVGRPPHSDDPLVLMTRKLQTPQGKRRYALRKQIVEPVIGQLKEIMGVRRFLHRGLEKVSMEWSLACSAHNLKKLWTQATRS